MKTVRGYMKDESGDYINVLINNDEDILIKDFDFEDFCNIFNVD